MQLILTEDQELLAKTAADFVAERSPISRVRELRDSGDEIAFSKSLWREMAELGWVGIPFPESVGGAELGLSELIVVLEALGRNLAPEPFLSSVLLAGQALSLGGSDAQREGWLPGIVKGEKILALAYQEAHSRYDLCRVATRAESHADGWRLRGEKVQVLDGKAADAIIVSARSAGDEADREGISLFLVPANAAGLSIESQHRVDSRAAALISLDGVRLGRDALVGSEQQAAPLLERVVDGATVGLCAEMLGGMTEALDRTIAYLKQRKQFGVLIGSFQALKHRAARLFIELELSRSAVMAAARALDEQHPEAVKLVSLAKARCSDAYIQVSNEAIQMFGGVGMTDEYDIGFFLKRARAADATFGDAAWHRDRWAKLSSY